MNKAPGRLLLFVLLGSMVAVGGLAAQSSAPDAARRSTADTTASVAPGEPEIVMPQVVLQIEDLSVEKVEAQLPPEEELLPPERPIPVLSEGDLAVGEPAIPAPAANVETATGQQSDRFLSSEIDLGAGSQNGIVGSISLKTTGQDPRFSLLFNHETLDGFSGQPAGSGFSLRNDSLDGSLKLNLAGIGTELGGSFLEVETGLQGHSPFVARLARSLAASTSLTATPLDWLTLRAGAEGGTDSLTLAGAFPLQLEGFRVAPSVSAEARIGAVKIGLDARYDLRVDPVTFMSAGGPLQRFQASASFGADLPAAFVLEGSGGWFWNSAGLNRVPFSISFTGTPSEFLTLSLDGGYRVTPYDMHDLLTVNGLAFANSIEDDRGWFGDSSIQFAISRDLAATLKLSFLASEAMPVGSTVQDSGTGLFVIGQQPGMQLSSDVGLRWGISQAFSVSAGWTQQYLARPFFTPLSALKTELIGLDPAGRFGGSVSVTIGPTVTGVLQQPVVRVSGFWKVSDAVSLKLDGDDLLWPLLGGPRMDIPPFATPGFRITGSVSINL